MKSITNTFSKLCCICSIKASQGLIKAQQACDSMQNKLHKDLQNKDEGAVTAEYAVVLVAATAFAGALIAIAKSDSVRTAIEGLVSKALHVG